MANPSSRQARRHTRRADHSHSDDLYFTAARNGLNKYLVLAIREERRVEIDQIDTLGRELC